MANIEPRVLRGFRDYLPQKMIPRARMLATIEGVFQRFGFQPLMTPALEYLDILTGKYGEEGDSLLFRFQDQGGRDVALRYDLTVPLARVVAQHPELTLPFRRYQIAPVWRAEKPARGRFREFVQCDGDIVGSADMAADAELVQLAGALLEGLGVTGYEVRVNNRKVLTGLMHEVGVDDPGREAGILRVIDKLPKIGADEVRRLLASECALDDSQVSRVFEFLGISGSWSEVLAGLRALFGSGSRGLEGVRELEELHAIAAAADAGSAGSLVLDLSIARGLNYYSGTIYEVFLGALPGYGAVMGGGRYDGLVGVFKGQDVPAVGISLGIDRLLEGLFELGLLAEERSVAKVLVTVFSAETAGYSARAARLLRDAGIPCELFPAYTKIGKQLRHAERSAQRWVVVAGPDEVAHNEVALKDLTTGEQVSLALSSLVETLRERQAAG